MITYYRFNCLIFYSISPFLLWLSIFSDYLSISLSLFFYVYFFFLFTRLFLVGLNRCLLGLKWWFASVGFQRCVGWVSIPVLKLNRWLGFRGGLNWRGLLNQWWVFESVSVARACLNRWEWWSHGDQIGGCVLLGFQLLSFAFWIGVDFVVAVWIGGHSLFESMWRVVEPWKSN